MRDPRGHFNMSDVLTRSDIHSKVIASTVFTGLLALSAVRIPLPFTPVPVTLQVLVVLLAGMMLGRKWGAITVAQYVALGAMGLPIFSGFQGGASVLQGVTGGYLFGFIAAAYVSGWIYEQLKDRNVFAAWIGGGVGIAVIYLFGALWLATMFRSNALQFGILPFVGIDLFKAAIAASIVSCRK